MYRIGESECIYYPVYVNKVQMRQSVQHMRLSNCARFNHTQRNLVASKNKSIDMLFTTFDQLLRLLRSFSMMKEYLQPLGTFGI